ncbi:hypothetical protein A4X16_04000 [Microbacterium sp. H83]|nr:hypothetical protein A4X16_04000 [Microbacterium sp. H83]
MADALDMASGLVVCRVEDRVQARNEVLSMQTCFGHADETRAWDGVLDTASGKEVRTLPATGG